MLFLHHSHSTGSDKICPESTIKKSNKCFFQRLVTGVVDRIDYNGIYGLGNKNFPCPVIIIVTASKHFYPHADICPRTITTLSLLIKVCVCPLCYHTVPARPKRWLTSSSDVWPVRKNMLNFPQSVYSCKKSIRTIIQRLKTWVIS